MSSLDAKASGQDDPEGWLWRKVSGGLVAEAPNNRRSPGQPQEPSLLYASGGW